MRVITASTSLGTFVFVLLLLQEVNSHSMWNQDISPNSPTTLDNISYRALVDRIGYGCIVYTQESLIFVNPLPDVIVPTPIE